MKKLSFLPLVFLATTIWGQTGHQITVTFKPFKNQYIYLGHYFGKQYPIIDSVKLDANSTGVFKGSKKLPGGIYLVGYPDKTGFFEILIDKQQQFSIIADTATLKKGIQFKNSPDNVQFNAYQQAMSSKGRQITQLRNELKGAGQEDSARVLHQLDSLDHSIRALRVDIIEKQPNTLLATLLNAMREPELPAQLRKPANKEDSVAAYRFFHDHFWDGVNFWDGRLAYTTFFEDKLDKYYSDLVYPNPDSVIREMDNMLAYATPSEEMTRQLLLKFVNRYLNQRYMWEDAVFVHLFEKYFAQRDYDWLTPAGRKTITDRAYNLMANIMGKPAADIELPDSNGVSRQLYADTGQYTVVCFWDATCGHCKETLPKLDSLFQEKWKNKGVSIYAISKQTDGTRADWLEFLRKNNFSGWTNVFYSKDDEQARVNASIPGYSQLYDVQTFPTLYLLDKDKRIIAKKLTVQQTDEVLQIKMKTQ